MDLIAGDPALSGVEYYLFSRPQREQVLGRFLENFRNDYDLILIDTPHSVNLLTLNALVASDRVLVPVQPEFFSLVGIVKIQETIEDARARWNPGLALLGVVASQVSGRRKLSGEVIASLREGFGERCFQAVIRDSVAVAESPGHARSVLRYDRSGPGAEDFRSLARELVARLGFPSPRAADAPDAPNAPNSPNSPNSIEKELP
jgi:chromosome partitioning protein